MEMEWRLEYQNICILAHAPIRMGFDHALDCCAGVELLDCHVARDKMVGRMRWMDAPFC